MSEKAELTVRKKLESINAIKKNKKNLKVGVLGCMAERLKEKFLVEEKIVDLVVGPVSAARASIRSDLVIIFFLFKD